MTLPSHSYVVCEEKLPGCKDPLVFSPFSVADKKNLLAAVSFKDAKAFIRTVVDVVERKTNLKKIAPDMPLHLVEAAFMHVYSKSSGGVIEATFTCNAEIKVVGIDGNDDTVATCNHPTPIRIPIDDVQIDWGALPEGKSYVAKLSGSTFVELSMPPWETMKKFVGEGNATVDINDDFVVACVRAVGDAEKTYTREDFTPEELAQWINDLSAEDGELLEPFFANMPVISKSFPVTCPKCGTTKTIVLRGLDDFFV